MKGVTSGQSLQGAFLESISILTPAKGVTPRCDRGGRRVIHFNSHPREGGDVEERLDKHDRLFISILTPVKGVTDHTYGQGVERM